MKLMILSLGIIIGAIICSGGNNWHCNAEDEVVIKGNRCVHIDNL